MERYEENLRSTFDAKSADLTKSLRDIHPSLIIDPEDEDQSFYDDFARVIDDARLNHADGKHTENVEVTSDPYVGVEMAIRRGADGETVHAKVRKHLRNQDGELIGVAHSNPLLDSRKYEVEYVDGHVEELTANVIAENIIAQVDEEGRRQMMLSTIVDHRVLHDAIPKSQGTYENSYGIKQRLEVGNCLLNGVMDQLTG